jgi:8-oxo-dGTP pyrophosphatase MutT (NUDIX family)
MSEKAFDADGEIVHAAMRPKDAATLILVKRDGEARVLMGQRHSGLAFMAGKYVFPGGRVDPADQRIATASELRPEVLEKLCVGATPARARGLALAAIRETIEETGVIVGTRAEKCPRTRSAAWSKYFAHGIMPQLDALDFIARAITPPNRPRRFDARFFMADASAIAHVIEDASNEELLKPCWLTLAEARALDLPSITRRVLEEVEARLSSGPHPVLFFKFQRGKAQLSYL